MLTDNLRLLILLYRGPARAFSRIIDEGSLVFGIGSVVLVSLLLIAGIVVPIWGMTMDQLGEEPAPVPSAAPGEPAPLARPFDSEGNLTLPGAAGSPRALWAQAIVGVMASSAFTGLVTLALVYVPACILVVTWLAPVGSFGVAFRRDYGSLLLCALFAWTAALLPVALVALGAPGPFWLVRPLVVLAGVLAFAVLMVPAVRTVFGVSRPIAAGVVVVAGFALPLSVFVPYLASPFVLYLGWLFLRGELGDVRASLSGRRSFKRFLEAATLNPRDAEAHYNLGLLHMQRGQLAEARSRFERAVEIDRGELDAHYQLGRLARAEKRAADAIRHFEAVVARDDAYARHEVWREIGATYLEADSLEHARWALEKFVARREHDPEGLLLLGDAHARAGDAAQARELFGRCVEAVDTMPGFRQREVARWKREAKKRLAALGGKP
jgi:hypothetical protein